MRPSSPGYLLKYRTGATIKSRTTPRSGMSTTVCGGVYGLLKIKPVRLKGHESSPQPNNRP